MDRSRSGKIEIRRPRDEDKEGEKQKQGDDRWRDPETENQRWGHPDRNVEALKHRDTDSLKGEIGSAYLGK